MCSAAQLGDSQRQPLVSGRALKGRVAWCFIVFGTRWRITLKCAESPYGKRLRFATDDVESLANTVTNCTSQLRFRARQVGEDLPLRFRLGGVTTFTMRNP